MRQTKEQTTNTYRVGLLFAELSKREAGDFVTHLQLLEWAGLKERNQAYYQAMTRVRKRLERERGLFLRSDRGRGYELVPHGEEHKEVTSQAVAGMRTIGTAVRRVNHIDLQAMPDEASRNKTIETGQKLANVYGVLRNSPLALEEKRGRLEIEE